MSGVDRHRSVQRKGGFLNDKNFICLRNSEGFYDLLNGSVQQKMELVLVKKKQTRIFFTSEH